MADRFEVKVFGLGISAEGKTSVDKAYKITWLFVPLIVIVVPIVTTFLASIAN